MIPAFSLALQQLKSNPTALGRLIAAMASGGHGTSYADPGRGAAATGSGAAALGQVFGSPEAIRQVVEHVAEASGVSPQAIEGMLPAVASMLLGGLAHTMAS